MKWEASKAATEETKLFTLMSKVRTSAGELSKALTKVEDAVKGTGSLADALADAKSSLKEAKIGEANDALTELLAGDVDLSHYADDALAAVTNLATVERRWPKPPTNPPPQPGPVSAAVDECRQLLEDAIYHCVRVTIRRDVTWELESTRVGHVLDFKLLPAASGLADDKQRTRVLDYLKHRVFGGWVDVDGARIYKLPPAGWKRGFACAAPFVTVILVAAALYGFSLFDVSGFGDGEQLLLILALVLGGTLAQLSAETIKQSLSKTVPILAVSDGIDWLALRWLGLVKTVLVALFVVVGLRVAGVEPNGQGLTICIAAGYSLDSVAGIFLTRFNNTAAGGKVALRQLLGS